jgi:hypothetical protein
MRRARGDGTYAVHGRRPDNGTDTVDGGRKENGWEEVNDVKNNRCVDHMMSSRPFVARGSNRATRLIAGYDK